MMHHDFGASKRVSDIVIFTFLVPNTVIPFFYAGWIFAIET